MPDVGYIQIATAQKTDHTAQSLLIIATLAAATAGFIGSTAPADPDLTHLLRAMAALKALAAAALVAATVWRLASPITPTRLAAYIAACATMAAGPGLIWNMAHLKLGALLLHAGLLATVILLWRDPATHTRLETIIARRRAALRGLS